MGWWDLKGEGKYEGNKWQPTDKDKTEGIMEVKMVGFLKKESEERKCSVIYGGGAVLLQTLSTIATNCEPVKLLRAVQSPPRSGCDAS